jgi:ABC-type dipeptide/oligopeptide/nickel transport system permease subunit
MVVTLDLCAFVALFAPWIAPYGEVEVVSRVPFDGWSAEHLLGTDQLGRDFLSRLIYGARNSISIALITTILIASPSAAFWACSPPWSAGWSIRCSRASSMP